MSQNTPIQIGKRLVGPGHPAYIIAEIGSNFDHDLERAKLLAKQCKEAGADAYKIQNFLAEKIVSAEGFKNMKIAHQAKWDKPVFDVYKAAEFPREWVKELAAYCKEIDIEFFSSPYDIEAVDMLEEIGVAAHKIGSGEIDNYEFIEYIAKTGKPIILATGSGTIEEVAKAVETIRSTGNEKIILLQCVTNYPAPIADAELQTMVAMGEQFDVVYGYSDHTVGSSQGGDDPLNGLTVPLGMAALGGSMIEKHVTDDATRTGPDHTFALTIGGSFIDMIKGIRAMESALGTGKKRVMPSEEETVIVQRRGIYTTRAIAKGETITRDALEYLRPATGLRPPQVGKAVGAVAAHDITAGAAISLDDLS